MEPGRRHTNLVAAFLDGYANGWHMAVKECYRNELDIKYTERKKNKQSFFEWTQGPYYSFAEGHIFFDTPIGYEKWGKALRAIKICCKIDSATPTVLDKNKKLIEGTVALTIYKPSEKLTSMKVSGNFKLSQVEFVNFLKTGLLNEKGIV